MTFFDGVVGPPARRCGAVDVHTTSPQPRPAVVLVHGGPIPPDARPRPRESPVFAGYAALAAAAGLAAVTFDHRLHSAEHYPDAAADVAAAVEQARGLEEVDADRVALWFFSGGGALAADWLRATPPWLRAVAWTYPVLAPPPSRPDLPRFDCVAAVAGAAGLPGLLVRVGREYAALVPAQDAFVAAAPSLEVIDIPDAEHGYEIGAASRAARAAIERAVAWVAATLTRPAVPTP